MRTIRWWAVLVAVQSAAACGGGDDAGVAREEDAAVNDGGWPSTRDGAGHDGTSGAGRDGGMDGRLGDAGNDGEISDEDASIVDGGAERAEDAGPIDGAPDAGGGEAAVDACAMQPDEPDELGADTNCDGADGVVGRDVYVDFQNGSPTNPGTPTSPMQTLEAALTRAVERNGYVLVRGGHARVEALSVRGRWSVHGGYDRSFLTVPKRDATVLQVDARGLLLEGADYAELAHLTVQGDDADATTPTRTAHALRTRIARLELFDVRVQAGSGLGGENGEPGVDGEPGIAALMVSRSTETLGARGLSCHGVPMPAYADGASPGLGNAEGRPAGSPTGGTGSLGSAGSSAAPTPELERGWLRWVDAQPGSDNGAPGYGGPGGVGPDTFILDNNRYQVAFGGGGTGGCPGRPGGGGQSGGGAVAILVLDGVMQITRSALGTGDGGGGGEGGLGGDGGPGGAGATPLANAYYPPPPAMPPNLTFTTPCQYVPGQADPDPTQNQCRGFGGWGGPGGRGGRGGGGAGGWTIGVAMTRSATATLDALTLWQFGKPGLGGRGDGAIGPGGESA